MDLKYVKLSKFKRFEEATLQIQNKLVALIGANESGKSSILQALAYLNSDKRISKSDITNGLDISDNEIIIEAVFCTFSITVGAHPY